MMQQKHIVGESQALLNEKAAQTQAAKLARAAQADMTQEERFEVYQAENRQTALETQRAGERYAEQIVDDYEARVREQAIQAYRDGEQKAESIAEQARQNAVSAARWAGVASVAQAKQEGEQKNIFQKISSAISPLLYDALQQIADFNSILAKPSNSTGPLWGSEKYTNTMLMLQGLGTLIDQKLFRGGIQSTTTVLKENLEASPIYNTTINNLEFRTGAVFQYLNDNSFGLFEKVLHVNWENGGDAFQSGRQLGRTASNIQGAVEFVTGAAAAAFFLSSIPPTGGVTAACAGATGGLCLPIGVIAIPVELALAGASVAVSAHGSAMLANNYNNRSEIRGNGGGEYLSPDPENAYYRSNKQNTSRNSDELYKNMGKPKRLDGYQAHHIIPSTSTQYGYATEARQILEEYGIDINQAENGVMIPRKVNGSLNNPNYEEAVLNALQDAKNNKATKEDILYLLQDIGNQILATGTYP